MDANVGAYQIYANANIGTIKTTLTNLDANVGAYHIYANANVGAYQTYANNALNSSNANVGAYQTYTNANIGSYQIYANNAIGSSNANVGAYQTYANNALNSSNANVGAYQTYANSSFSSLATNANANTAAYLVTGIVGNISAGNINVANTANVGNLATAGTVTAKQGTFGNITTTNDIYSTNISATSGYFSTVSGTLTTAVQTAITQVGTLSSLIVSGSMTIGQANINVLYAPSINGSLASGPQIGITQVGTLIDLNVSGDTSLANVTTGNITGNLRTASQPFITYVGNLTTANVDGNLIAGNVISNLTGNVLSASQPFITYVGNLVTANVTGNLIAGNVNSVGTGRFRDLIVSNLVYVLANTVTSNISTDTATVSTILYSLGNLNAANVGASGLVRITNASESTNATTGALVVAGGAAIGANLYISGNTVTQGNLVSGNVVINPLVADKTAALSVYGDINLYGAAARNIRSNGTNVQMFSSTVTDLDLGAAATTLAMGSTAGSGNVLVRNGLVVQGNIIGNIRNNSSVTNYATISSNLLVTGNSLISGTATTVGNVNTTGNVNVTGNSYLTGNVTISSNLLVSSNANVDVMYVNSVNNARNTSSGALQVKGGASIVGNVFTTGTTANIWSFTQQTTANTGALVVAGGASVGGNIYVGGDMNVAGNVQFSSFVANSINAPIGGTTPNTAIFTTVSITNVRPTRRPVLMFDFANSKKLDAKLTFTRASTGTYVGPRGNLMVAGTGVPRFTHDPVTKRSRGLLIEESRQNLYQQSNGFGNATIYSATRATISSVTSATTSPAGTYDAYKITEDNSNNTHFIQQFAYLPTLSLSTTYTASIFAKAAERDQITLYFNGEGNGPVFDLTLATVISEPAGYAASITQFANSWVRCSATLTKSVNTSGIVFVGLATGGSYSYTGDNTSGVYIYGFQLETGGFGTSYIPTTTIANTRAQDTLTVQSTAFNNAYAVEAGTVLVDTQIDYRPTSKVVENSRSTIFSFSDGTVSNRVSLVTENHASPSVYRGANLVVYNGGTLQTNLIVATANLTTLGNGLVATYFANSAVGSTINAGTVATASGGILNITGAINTLTIGSGPGTGSLNGTIAKLAYYGDVVSTAELQNLSKQ